MAHDNIKTRNYAFIIISLALMNLLYAPSTVLAKSHRPISDSETRQKKNECYADIESGLWGWRCKSSVIAKENCVLKCLSPSCYELIYESDPVINRREPRGNQGFVRLLASFLCGSIVMPLQSTFLPSIS